MENLKKYNQTTTPFHFSEQEIEGIANSVTKKLGENIYISFDMDCINPSFALGVSVSVPFGLSRLDCVCLLQRISKNGIIGMDIMEVCPSFDIKDRMSHLASRMIAEVLFSFGESQFG